MAVAVDVTGTEVTTGTVASPRTYTGLTTGSSLSNGAVAFIVCYANVVTGSSATWDGVACTLVASQNNSIGCPDGRVEIWALSPLGAHEGNKTFSVSWTGGGSTETYIVGLSFTGVDQTGGVTSFPHGTGANGTSSTSSVTVTSATGNIVVAGHTSDNGIFNSVNNTTIF